MKIQGVKPSFANYIRDFFKSSTSDAIALGISLVALASAAILIRLGLNSMSPNATIFHRLWIATIALWLIESCNPKKPQQICKEKPLPWERGLLVVVAIASTASVMCWAWSLTQTSVANSTVLRNLTPLFVALGGWLWYGKLIEPRCAMGMAVATVGAIAIGCDDLQVGWEHIWGDGIALLSAMLYAVYLMAIERLTARYSSQEILLWRCGLGFVLMLPLMINEASFFPNSAQEWLVVIALALICQVLGQGLLIYSCKQFSASFVAFFLLLQPAIAAILAWVIFAESLSSIDVIAFALVMSGIYLAQSGSTA